MRRSMIVLVLVGIAMIGCGGPWQQRTDDIDAARRTVADMLSLGVAMEAYAVDNNFYPKLDVRDVPASVLKSRIEPTYMKKVPETDRWGHPLYVRGNADGTVYVISSYGADGVKDAYTPQGATTDVSADIVYTQAQFVQWPAWVRVR